MREASRIGADMEDNDQALGAAYESPSVEVVSADVIESSVAILLSGGGGGGGGTGGGGTVTPAVGTESNPYVLTEGVAKTVSSSSCWFKCTVSGAVNITVTPTSGNASMIKIYLQSGTKKDVLRQQSGDDVLTCKANEVGVHTYYAHCAAVVTTKFICSFEQNEDENTQYPTRTEWCASKDGGYSLDNYRYLTRRFLSRLEVEEMIGTFPDDSFLSLALSFLEGEIAEEAFRKAVASGGWELGLVNSVLLALACFLDTQQSFSFSAIRNEIRDASGFADSGHVECGIIFDLYDSGWNGTYCDVLAWASGVMRGPKGSRGYYRAPSVVQLSELSEG